MRASAPSSLHLLLVVVLVGGLLLGDILGVGSTSDSPTSTSPDTGATSTAAAPVSDVDEVSSPSFPTSSSAPVDSARTVSQRLADASVKARIKQALVDERSLRAFNFFPEVVRGRVTLRGNVDTREQYRRAERITETLEGVETVMNQISVEGHPVSETDNASAPSSTPGAEYHTVQRGDTLWKIAREYEISIPEIKALNPHSTSSPRPGERLRVR